MPTSVPLPLAAPRLRRRHPPIAVSRHARIATAAPGTRATAGRCPQRSCRPSRSARNDRARRVRASRADAGRADSRASPRAAALRLIDPAASPPPLPLRFIRLAAAARIARPAARRATEDHHANPLPYVTGVRRRCRSRARNSRFRLARRAAPPPASSTPNGRFTASRPKPAARCFSCSTTTSSRTRCSPARARRASHPRTRMRFEQKTLSQTLIASLDYAFNRCWGLTATLPVVSKRHDHLADPYGDPTPESWNFTDLGDARIVGRYRFAASDASSTGVQFGVVLPTGPTNVTNAGKPGRAVAATGHRCDERRARSSTRTTPRRTARYGSRRRSSKARWRRRTTIARVISCCSPAAFRGPSATAWRCSAS